MLVCGVPERCVFVDWRGLDVVLKVFVVAVALVCLAIGLTFGLFLYSWVAV